MNTLQIEIQNQLKMLAEQIGKIPSLNFYDKNRKKYNLPYGKGKITTVFGSWKNAIETTFEIVLKVNHPRITINCVQCGKETKNPKFCSKSCSASFNNAERLIDGVGIRPRKNPNKPCAVCGDDVIWRSKFCSKCAKLLKSNTGEYVSFETITKAHFLSEGSQRHARIRVHARTIALDNHLLDKCFICGYSTYVECCHIQSIASFSDDSLLKEINDPERNLIGLCPNHHWEFDHSILSKDNLERILTRLNH